MNLIIFFFTLSVRVFCVKSHVISSIKKADETTPSLADNQTHKDLEYTINEKKSFLKTLKVDENRIYLEDVFFSIQNQNWTEEEQPCLNKTLVLLRSLQNSTLWAVWNWDSVSSQPQGLLYGSRYQLGNFDECINPPWYKEYPELKTQYCLSEIVLKRLDKTKRRKTSNPYDPQQSALNLIESQSVFHRPLNELTWGVCVPAECQPRSVEKLMRTMLARSHLGTARLQAHITVSEKCQRADEPRSYDAAFYAFVGLVVCLVTMALICTWIQSEQENFNFSRNAKEIISAFDLKCNARSLLTIRKGGADVLYGIKFLTMFIVVSGHQYGFFNGGPISNGYQVDKDASSIIGALILHSDLIVDTFFTLSGFLTAIYITKIKNFGVSLYLIVKRYFRLSIALALTIFYTSAVFPYTGSGPLWNRAIAAETEQCRKNWWLNLLMVSNYIDSENMCIVISWYVPCEFQFFLFTLLMYWIYRRFPTVGRLLWISVFIASILIPGIINYIHKLPAIQAFTYDFLSNPRGPKQFHLTYIKSHTRYAPYLIGFIGGYILTYHCIDTSARLKRVSRKWSTLGAYVSLAIMAIIMFTGPLLIWKDYKVLESAIYAAVNRALWAACIVILVLSCALGPVPIVKGFLTWYPWVPLSRLTFGIYLSHALLINRNVFSSRNPQYNDYLMLTVLAAGVFCVAALVSLLMWLFAEAPINNLVTFIFNGSIPKSEETEPRNKETDDPDTRNTGHLQNNIPTSISIISSKI